MHTRASAMNRPQATGIALCMALLSLAGASPASGPATGVYAGAGCPKNADSCTPTTTRDRLEIVRKDDRLVVSLRVFFDQGHRCELQGLGVAEGDKLLVSAQVPDSLLGCTLQMDLRGDRIDVHDPQMQCLELFCGTRGVLDGLRFKKIR